MAEPDADQRKLAEQALNGLIIYAEEHAQEIWPPLFHIRKIVGEISAYWDLEKDWQRNFNSRLLLSYYDQKAEEISDEARMNTVLGLACYMEEMFRTHGLGEGERILEIQMLIKDIGSRWKLPKGQMRDIDMKVEQMTREAAK